MKLRAVETPPEIPDPVKCLLAETTQMSDFPGFPIFGILGRLEVAVRFALSLTVAVVTVFVVGCLGPSKPAVISTRHMGSFTLPVWTVDGMYLVTGPSGTLFLSTSPLDINRYRGVVLEEIQISTKPRSRDIKPSEEKRLKGYLTRRLERMFRRNGWPIEESPGEDVLRVRLAVKGIELERWRGSRVGRIVKNPSADRITIVLELRDAEKNERILLFGKRRRLPFGVYNGWDAISIRRVEDAFDDFSIDTRRLLQEVQRGDFPPPPPRPSPMQGGLLSLFSVF